MQKEQHLSNQYILKRLNALIKSPYERENIKQNLTEENKQKLLSLKNAYKGKRCFIIGSSPSLKQLDLTKLNNEHTFTVNRGYKLTEQGLKHSTFHVMSDCKTFTDDKIEDEIPKDWAKFFFTYAGIKFPLNQAFYFNYIINNKLSDFLFQTDITKNLGECGTIIYFAIQFSFYMGFKDIYLIGVDLDFDKNKGHIYKETNGETKRQEEHSINNADRMLNGIAFATEFLQNNNVNIYNASPVGIVDCMPRIKYEELF